MKNRTTLMLVGGLFALAIILSLASCSSDSPTGSNSTNGGGMPSPNTVNITGNSFSPATLSVKAGTTVTWTNKDAALHTVTSNTGTFTSSGDLSLNETYQVTFNTVGTFAYHCSKHPSMTGTIGVTP